MIESINIALAIFSWSIAIGAALCVLGVFASLLAAIIGVAADMAHIRRERGKPCCKCRNGDA